jgi:hypothetical protein
VASGKRSRSSAGSSATVGVTLVPDIKALTGGHTFMLAPEGGATRVDHELEMTPRGAWKLIAPVIPMIGRRNLRETATALKGWVERPSG